MSTRGFVGFRNSSDKKELNYLYGIYNKDDSYYSNLGMKLLDKYMELKLSELNEIFSLILWLKSGNTENKCDVDELFTKKAKPLINEKEFLYDGLYCEYGYIFNLKTDKLEIYRGYFEEYQEEGLKNIYYKTASGKKFYTHCVYEVERGTDYKKLKMMFDNEKSIAAYYYEMKIKYYEKAFMIELNKEKINEIINFEY